MPSSVIAGFDYDSSLNELTIAFTSGRVYVYSLVPPTVVSRLREAFSKGAYFNKAIRDRFPYRELLRRQPAVAPRPTATPIVPDLMRAWR